MTDIWVCSTCSSINRQRNPQCYKCGGPQSAATGVLADVRTDRAIEARAVVAYRSSLLRAIVAAAFMVAVAVLGVVVLIESIGVVQYIRDEIPILLQTGEVDQAELVRRASGAIVPALLRPVAAIGALLFFAAWLSRVIMNVPALGGGTPGATPTKAFLYPLIPVWNLFKTPSIVQDALYRLDPKAGGFFMLLVAWIGLVGSAIASFIVGWWVDLRIATVVPRAQTLGDAIEVFEGAYDMQFLVDVVTTLMVSFGAIVLVVIMFRIESRAAARDREIRKAEIAPRPEPGSVAARPGGVSYEAAAAGARTAAVMAVAPPAMPARSDPPATAPPDQPATAPADPVREQPMLATTGRPEPAFFEDAGKRRHDDEVVPLPTEVLDVGPHLIVAVGGRDLIRAELDGESEAITLDDLRSAAVALARSGGSAVVTTTTDTADARWMARDVAAALRDSGVPTTFED